MLALLFKMPLLGKLLLWIAQKLIPKLKEKHRLYVEYILVGLCIVAATLAVTVWLQRERVEQKLAEAGREIKSLQTRTETVEFINELQQITISQLEKDRERDQQALSGLNSDYKAIHQRNERVQQRIRELEKQSEKVRNYLDEPIPDELISLLY